MPLINETPFPAELFEQLNMQGRMNGVVSIRGTFVVRPDRRLAPAEDQAPFVWEDTYIGDPLTTPMLAATDLAPYKPGTDVTFLGSSFAPDGQPRPAWQCGIAVAGRFDKKLRVTGPRSWVPAFKTRRTWFGGDKPPDFQGWTLTSPEPALETPICWTQAFGGSREVSPEGKTEVVHHPDNWIGVGWLDAASSPKDAPLPAPRIEHPDDPIADWRRLDHKPQGFAPIAPFWEVRRHHVGTIDEPWIANRHPLLPTDFDFKFWQSAHPDCVADPWLNGHEVITLTQLHRDHELLRVALPDIELRATLKRDRRPDESHPVVLDGVHFDFRSGADTVFLTWRTGFPWPDGEGDIVLEGGVRG